MIGDKLSQRMDWLEDCIALLREMHSAIAPSLGKLGELLNGIKSANPPPEEGADMSSTMAAIDELINCLEVVFESGKVAQNVTEEVLRRLEAVSIVERLDRLSRERNAQGPPKSPGEIMVGFLDTALRRLFPDLTGGQPPSGEQRVEGESPEEEEKGD